MGRPPIGKVRMTAAEKQKRYRDRLRASRPATKPASGDNAALVKELAAAKRAMRAQNEQRVLDVNKSYWAGYFARERADWEREHPGQQYPEHECGLNDREYADLERWRRQRENPSAVARTAGRRDGGHLDAETFTEVGKLRAENRNLKSDVAKLKMMLQEEPDAAKLRKKVIDQQVEMASLRRTMKEIAKERDEYKRHIASRAPRKYAEVRQSLTRQNYNVLIKALHPDRAKHASAAELAEAGRVVTGLRPLFDETQG
jgi:hypothetical protein